VSVEKEGKRPKEHLDGLDLQKGGTWFMQAGAEGKGAAVPGREEYSLKFIRFGRPATNTILKIGGS